MDIFSSGLISPNHAEEMIQKICKNTVYRDDELQILSAAIDIVNHHQEVKSSLNVYETLLDDISLILLVKSNLFSNHEEFLVAYGSDIKTEQYKIIQDENYSLEFLCNLYTKIAKIVSSHGVTKIDPFKLFFNRLQDCLCTYSSFCWQKSLVNCGSLYTYCLNQFSQDDSYKILIDSVMCGIISKLDKNDDTCQVKSLLNYFIEPYVRISDISSVCKSFHNINMIIMGSFTHINFLSMKQNYQSTYFIILFLFDQHLLEKNSDLVERFLANDFIWLAIQNGLKSRDPLIRKQSLYMLKGSVNYFSQENQSCSIFTPYSEQFGVIWNDYFLCLETAEEEQAHVVSPVVCKLDFFWEKVKKKTFHPFWIYVLYTRLLMHLSKQIKYDAICHILSIEINPNIQEELILFVPHELLPSINDYHLFRNAVISPGKDSLPKLLERFFSKFSVFPDTSIEKLCQSILTEMFKNINWDEIAFYHALNSLTFLPVTRCLDYDAAKKVANSAKQTWASQEKLIRSACKETLLLFILRNIRGSITQQFLPMLLLNFEIHKMKKFPQIVNDFILPNYVNDLSDESNHFCSLPIVDALDTVLAFQLNVPRVSESIVSTLTEYEKSDGAENDQLYYKFQSLKHKLSFLLKLTCIENKTGISDLASHLVNSFYHIHLQSINCRSPTICSKQLIYVEHLHATLKLLLQEEYSSEIGISFSERYYCALKDHIESHSKYGTPQCALVLHCLAFLSSNTHLLEESKLIELDKLISSHVLEKLPFWRTRSHFVQRIVSSQAQQRDYDALVSPEKLSSKVWMCLAAIRNEITNVQQLDEVFENLSESWPSVLPHIFSTAERLTSFAIETKKYPIFLDQLFVVWSEMRSQADTSHVLLKSLARMLFHERVASDGECCAHSILICTKLIAMAEAARGIAPLLAANITILLEKTLEEHELDVTNMVKSVYVPLLVFGPLPDKKLRALRETEDLIVGDAFCGLKQFNESISVRSHTVIFLLRLKKISSHERSKYIVDVMVKELCLVFDNANRNSKRTRDFSNSLAHRVKTRVMQALIVIIEMVPEPQSLLSWVSNAITKEQQQPSVRYLLEWSVSLLVLKHHLYDEFFLNFSESVDRRIGCAASFLVSLNLICSNFGKKDVLQHIDFVRKAIEFSLQWCMGQQFNGRLYAQTTLSKIWEMCEKLQVKDILEEYAPVARNLQFVASQARTVKNSDNLILDFFYSSFDALKNLTIETIYYDLPRLSEISSDEWLDHKILLNLLPPCQLDNLSIPVANPLDNKLTNVDTAPWVSKSAHVGTDVLPVSSKLSNNCDTKKNVNIQKKMTPWSTLSKQLKVEALETQNILSSDSEVSTERSEIIVVASLLSKSTNIGGLCRTCEVLGVKKLVIPSLGVMEDQSFLGLTVSAHKWIQLKEISKDGLSEYLLAMKTQGYVVVAAEQTVQSVSVMDYSFQPKTLLLLGNEREGVPCDLLQKVDVCVEIPQFGVTRSLNAHVAGSLCVWEYVRQHASATSSS